MGFSGKKLFTQRCPKTHEAFFRADNRVTWAAACSGVAQFPHPGPKGYESAPASGAPGSEGKRQQCECTIPYARKSLRECATSETSMA